MVPFPRPSFINNSATEATLIVGGERSKTENRIFYPVQPQGVHDRRPTAPKSSSA